ncbi:MAG: hypothetical protein LBP75_08170 [Planctomycetota bacterium]|nr:hypothetical protein [Planctomycetota bacterium]
MLNYPDRAPRKGRSVTAQRNALGKNVANKYAPCKGSAGNFHCSYRAPICFRQRPSPPENQKADFPLGWAVTLCRFAATVGDYQTGLFVIRNF